METKYRPTKDGEYWDICSADGFMRRVGCKKSDIQRFIDRQRESAKEEYDLRMKDLRDLELRLAESTTELHED